MSSCAALTWVLEKECKTNTSWPSDLVRPAISRRRLRRPCAAHRAEQSLLQCARPNATPLSWRRSRGAPLRVWLFAAVFDNYPLDHREVSRSLVGEDRIRQYILYTPSIY